MEVIVTLRNQVLLSHSWVVFNNMERYVILSPFVIQHSF